MYSVCHEGYQVTGLQSGLIESSYRGVIQYLQYPLLPEHQAVDFIFEGVIVEGQKRWSH
jgi:hypothetical protein